MKRFWPKEPPDSELLRNCNAGEGLCLLPEHPGDCITYEDVVATPALENAKPCEECGHYRGHARSCFHTHKQHD